MLRYEHGGDVFGKTPVSLDFSVNVNPLGMPEEAKRALVADIDAFVRYPDCECRALRAALASRLGLDEENILCGNGASDLILRVCAALKPGCALTLAPAFSEYERSARLFGASILEYPLAEGDGFQLTEGFLSALTPKVGLLFLCNPNNPTGRLIEPALLRAVLDKCRENGIAVLLDECFIGFTDAVSSVSLLDAYPDLMILRAFTKLYGMAGLRLGYLLANVSLLGRIAAFGAQWSVSAPAQAAGLAALGVTEWEARTKALVKRERAYMTDALSELGLTVFPSDANFLLIKGEAPLCEPLRARGILVRACDNFSGLDARFIRIGLKTRDKNEMLINAIQEVLHG